MIKTNFLKLIGGIFFMTTIISSCGNSGEAEADNKDENSWSEENKAKFVAECSKGGAPEKTCECMVEKLAEKYSSITEAKEAMESDKEAAMQMAMECL